MLRLKKKMINWIKELLGIAYTVAETTENIVEEVKEAVEEIIEDVDLATMKKADLIQLAEERGVEVKASWTKAKIIAALDT